MGLGWDMWGSKASLRLVEKKSQKGDCRHSRERPPEALAGAPSRDSLALAVSAASGAGPYLSRWKAAISALCL